MMTDAQSAQTALDKLIEAVEAGDEGTSLMRAMPDGTSYEHIGLIYSAAKGSLDAALALHETLLPGWDALIDLEADVSVSNGAKSLGEYRDYFGKAERSPARGWLLAILRAYRSAQK